MKKIALFVALALMISVGGVYATWYYAEGDATPDSIELAHLSMAQPNLTTSSGTLDVTDTLTLIVDDNSDALMEHIPEWTDGVDDTSAGSIVINFTPNEGASSSTFTYTLTVEDYTYNSTIDSTERSIFKDLVDLDTSASGMQVIKGSFSFTAGQSGAEKTLNLSDVTSVLKLDDTFTLSTYDRYLEYATALDNVVLTLSVTQD